jgi:hypothetical protein
MCRRFCRPNRIACSKSVCDELCPSPTNAARGSRCAQQAPKQGRCTTRVRLQARRRSGAELGGSAQGAHCGTALRGGSARRQAAAGFTRACHALAGRASSVQRALSERRARAQGGCRTGGTRRAGDRTRRACPADKRAGPLGASAPRTPRTRRAVGVCLSRAGRSAENTLARSRRRTTSNKRQEGERDKARGTALAASSSVERRAFRRRTFEASLGRRKDGRQSSCASGAPKREEW